MSVMFFVPVVQQPGACPGHSAHGGPFRSGSYGTHSRATRGSNTNSFCSLDVALVLDVLRIGPISRCLGGRYGSEQQAKP